MMTEAKLWFQARPPRERVLIAIMLVLMAITIGLLGIWRPLMSGLDSARERHEEAIVTLASTRMKAEALNRWDKLPGGASAIGVRETVGALATEAGFTLSRNDEVVPGSVEIVITSAKAAALFNWLEDLSRRGIHADRASMRANNDGTVSFDATLKGRSE
jgi:general secretion pathway protein M